MADLRRLFDQHGVRATFFVTHAGVERPGHERGLHHNFRRNGDSYKQVRGGEATLTDEQIHTHVVSNTLAFAPEAKGLRTHSLYYDSTLLPLYRLAGLEYDYSYQMPLVAGLRPFWKPHEIVEIRPITPTISTWATGFDLAGLALERLGVEVISARGARKFRQNWPYAGQAPCSAAKSNDKRSIRHGSPVAKRLDVARARILQDNAMFESAQVHPQGHERPSLI